MLAFALAVLLGAAACGDGKKKETVDAADRAEVAPDTMPLQNPCGTEDVSLRDRNASELFGMSTVPVFELFLPAADWEALKVNARDEQYVPAQACFQGKAIGVVGLRFKGSYGSLFNCFDATGKNTCRKLSMKIKFDEYVDDQSFYGLKRLNFQGYHFDSSYLRERLGYDLYRAMDIVAPRATWANLRVNGESQGLFGMVEQIDGRFTKDRWPANGDRNLFKERWPGGNLDDAWIAQGLETNQKTPDVTAFKAFSAAMGAAAPADARTVLASFTDLDYFARYMAVDDAIANFDGITTYYTVTGDPSQAGNHNFFFYEESPTKYTIIPWDLESTMSLTSNFGNVPSWLTLPPDCTTTYLAWGGPLQVIAPACDHVFRALGADLTSYRAAVAQLLAGPFAEATMLAKVDALAAFIRPDATVDPHGPGAAEFEGGVVSVRNEIPNLRRRLEYLASGKPIVPLEISVGTINDFEAADAYGITAGTTCSGNPKSTVSVAINDADPIDGSKTLRMSFTFVDEQAMWQQWMYYRVPLVAAPKDISALTGVRIKVRAEKARTLRFEVDSPKNSGTMEGAGFGWDVPAEPTAKTVTLTFASAALPSWAKDHGDKLTTILQSVTALVFRPKCNVGATGYLGAGVTDNGWIDVDDIEIF